jgi:ribonuclease HI
MAKKYKFYVVWKGRNPGIYDNWLICKAQVDGFDGPQFKSFDTIEEATEAYRNPYKNYISKPKTVSKNFDKSLIIPNSICVDASCLGNPGKMEYRGVDYKTGKEIFRKGIFEEATVNLGEFLAIVHGLSYLKSMNSKAVIYTDSVTAMAWVRDKKIKSTLAPTLNNELVFNYCEKALNWLHNNSFETQILKWHTEFWGEIPADFGRK